MKAKASAIVCAVLAGTFGFSSLAVAQHERGGGDRAERRAERRDRQEDRRDAREERRDHRFERRQDRREIQAGQQGWQAHRGHDRGYRQGYEQRQGGYDQRYYNDRQPQYGYDQPRRYDSHPHRFQRGGYLPYEYRQHRYYVNDWRSRGLYAPPYGYQWVQVDSDFVLVALATGLIANLLIN